MEAPEPAVLGPDIDAAFARALNMLTNPIRLFVSLPRDRLDRISLRRHLDEIGRHDDAPVTA